MEAVHQIDANAQAHAHDESSSRGADGASRVWYHFWFSTYGTWLRGDERGFRDHDHRIHSSGDYNNPPPREEHAGLRKWVKKVMHKDPVRLQPALRSRVGAVMLAEFAKRGVEIIVLAVGSDHVHGIGRFDEPRMRSTVGRAKLVSSHAIRADIPGVVWGKKCARKRIRSRAQQVSTFKYIAKHEREGAWVWTFRDGLPPG